MIQKNSLININWSNFDLFGDEIKFLNDAIKSKFVSGGPGAYVEKFENEMGRIFKNSQCISTSNGTISLQLAFQALGLKKGDEVVLPSYCYQAAGNVANMMGLKLVFSDVNFFSWNITLENIKKVYTKKTKAIVVVYNYGNSTDIDKIVAWAKQKKIWVIEDCAEAWFSKFKGKLLGEYGDIATFSMHAAKTISCGEGGCILINKNNKKLLKKASLLKDHGLNREGSKIVPYKHELPGNNYRLSNVLCSLAYAKLKVKKEIIQKQNKNHLYLFNELKKIDDIITQKSLLASKDSIWLNGILLNYNNFNISRDQLIFELKKENIETRPGFYSTNYLNYYKKNYLPISDFLSKNIIALPCNLHLDNIKTKRIINTLKNLITKYKRKKYYFIKNKITKKNLKNVLIKFNQDLKKSSKTFRYYKNRNIDAFLKLKICKIMYHGTKPIGYAHLDEENNTNWIGIAFIEKYTNKQLSYYLLSNIINLTFRKKVKKVYVRSDITNKSAIKLWNKFGFELVENNLKKKYCVYSLANFLK